VSREFLHQIFKDKNCTVGAEIGVAYGDNAIDMLDCMPELHLYLIDPWTGTKRSDRFYESVRTKAYENLAPYRERITIINATSEQAAPVIDERSLDFCYIDGDHRYDAVMLDIILWGRRVKYGGILSGHDYVRTRKHGVKRAVDDYFKYHHMGLKVRRGNWWWTVA
jgi:predicted O-methyltransferase YrrM